METIKNWIEGKSKTQLLLEAIRWPAIILISMWLFFPGFIELQFEQHGNAATQALCMSLLFYYNWDIVESIKSIRFKIPSVRVSSGHPSGSILNKNKDVEVVANFILQFGGLPVMKAKELLGWTGEKCKQIGDRLEEWNLMWQDKADCNKRKLREGIDYYTLAFALSYCLDATTTPEQLPQILEAQDVIESA